MQAMLEHVPCKITLTINKLLFVPYTSDEVKRLSLRCFQQKHRAQMDFQFILSVILGYLWR